MSWFWNNGNPLRIHFEPHDFRTSKPMDQSASKDNEYNVYRCKSLSPSNVLNPDILGHYQPFICTEPRDHVVEGAYNFDGTFIQIRLVSSPSIDGFHPYKSCSQCNNFGWNTWQATRDRRINCLVHGEYIQRSFAALCFGSPGLLMHEMVTRISNSQICVWRFEDRATKTPVPGDCRDRLCCFIQPTMIRGRKLTD